jgi:hypothetical protein
MLDNVYRMLFVYDTLQKIQTSKLDYPSLRHARQGRRDLTRVDRRHNMASRRCLSGVRIAVAGCLRDQLIWLLLEDAREHAGEPIEGTVLAAAVLQSIAELAAQARHRGF